MATVPMNNLPTVQQDAAPNFQEQNPVNADLLNIGAKQTQALGDGLVKLGGDVDYMQKQALAQANALRVDDAVNQATEHALRLAHDPTDGYTSQKGYAALNRDSGLPLADEYTGKLDQSISSISDSLGNDQQKRMFAMKVNNVRTSFLGNALQYESKEGQDYNLSVRDATVKNAANALVLNPLDPKNVDMQETRIRGAIVGGIDPDTGAFVPGAAQMQGKSGAFAQEKAAEAISGAHLASIKSLMDTGNVNAAMQYRQKYGDRMTAADMIQVDGTLQRNYDMQKGASVATNIVQSTQSTVNPSDMDRLTNVIMGQESGGKDTNAQGGILTSPKGAQGRMQVMPATNKDPGFGVRPAADDGPEERARVGRDYLGAMVKRYNGNIAMAAAAYNAGPGAVDKAVNDAKSNAGAGEQVSQDAWVASLPKETRAYVANVTAKMSNPVTSSPIRPSLEELHQTARAQLGPNASPLALSTAITGITQQYADQTAAFAQKGNDALSAVQQELISNGGKVDQVTPSKMADLARYAPGKYDDSLKFAKAISKGDNETNMAAYNAAITYPEEMAKMSDAQFLQFQKTNFSLADQEKVGKLRAAQINGSADASAGAINNKALTDALTNRLESIGINALPKRDDMAGQTRIGTIKKFAADSIYAQQAQLGRKMTPQEISEHVDGLFAKNVQFKTTFMGVSTGTSDPTPLLSMKPNDIPDSVRAALKQSFAARGQSNPTDQDLLGAYFKWKNKNG